MTIHPLPADAWPTSRPFLQAAPDTAQAAGEAPSVGSTAYDSIWGEGEAATGQALPTQQPDGFERAMMADGKIYVVLAVVLIIWLGLLFMLFRTDRKLDRLEDALDARAEREEDAPARGEAPGTTGDGRGRTTQAVEPNLSRDE
jgi:hypothetical protein